MEQTVFGFLLTQLLAHSSRQKANRAHTRRQKIIGIFFFAVQLWRAHISLVVGAIENDVRYRQLFAIGLKKKCEAFLACKSLLTTKEKQKKMMTIDDGDGGDGGEDSDKCDKPEINDQSQIKFDSTVHLRLWNENLFNEHERRGRERKSFSSVYQRIFNSSSTRRIGNSSLSGCTSLQLDSMQKICGSVRSLFVQ